MQRTADVREALAHRYVRMADNSVGPVASEYRQHAHRLLDLAHREMNVLAPSIT